MCVRKSSVPEDFFTFAKKALINNFFVIRLSFLILYLEKLIINILPHKIVNHCMKSVHIWSFYGPYLYVLTPNTGKYGTDKLWIRTLFTQLILHVHFYSKYFQEVLWVIPIYCYQFIYINTT